MGTGHVGLVTCVTFAGIGHEVVGTDVDVEKVELLQRGIPPFFEPGLEEAMKEESASGRLSFSTVAADALRDAEVVFICVGTPARANGDANLLAMEQSASQIARHAPDGTVVVEKSTVPAGTADRVLTTLQTRGRRTRVPRGVQSGIPPRGRGDARRARTRPHRDRHRVASVARRAQPSVRPAVWRRASI